LKLIILKGQLLLFLPVSHIVILGKMMQSLLGLTQQYGRLYSLFKILYISACVRN